VARQCAGALHASRSGPATVDELTSAVVIIELPPRFVIYNPGDTCKGLYFIASGKVKLAHCRGFFLGMQRTRIEDAIDAILKHRRYWQDQHLKAQAHSDLERIVLSHRFANECDLILSVLAEATGQLNP